MSCPFRVGDRVRRTGESVHLRGGSVLKGQTYTVAGVREGIMTLLLEGKQDSLFDHTRFELVQTDEALAETARRLRSEYHQSLVALIDAGYTVSVNGLSLTGQRSWSAPLRIFKTETVEL